MLEPLLRNWRLKLLSLGLAFALWVAVTGESPIVQDFQAPLVVSVGDGHTVAGRPPRTVTVRLRGPETLVRSVEAVRLEVVADLHDLVPGTRKVQLSPADVKGVPTGVKVDMIDPERVTVTVARKVRRTVPVIPAFLGKPPASYAFYGAQVLPDTVEIEGPEPEVLATSRVRTDPIHLDRATQPLKTRVGAVPDSLEVRIVGDTTVEVRAHVDATPVETVFVDVPVALAGQTHEARVSPSSVDVTLSGPPRLVRGLRRRQVRLVADLTGLRPQPTPYRVPLRVDVLDIPPSDLSHITVKITGNGWVEVQILDRRASG